MTAMQFNSQVIELNVGGVKYATCLSTLLRYPNSLLGQYFAQIDNVNSPPSHINERRPSFNDCPICKIGPNEYFIDRDGLIFRVVLDFLRNQTLLLSEGFCDCARLSIEASFYQLPELARMIPLVAPGSSGKHKHSALTNGIECLSLGTGSSSHGKHGPGSFIIVGYRGTFAFGRDGQADVKFRKLNRILVSGKLSICREVFGSLLNESRDPDKETNRYTSRVYLKHSCLEQAFEALSAAGFRLLTSCASGTSHAQEGGQTRGANSVETEEAKWSHYNEFVFFAER